MKKLFCERDLAGCDCLKAILESNGIACVIKNEAEATLFGSTGLFPGSAWPEVWVVNDEQFEDALKLLHPPPASADAAQAAGEPGEEA